MKKTRVLSVRLPIEALQSCFDLSDLAGAPTTVAGTAIARSISLLTANLRDQAKLPKYSPIELEKLTEKWASKINPASMPSLEIASQANFDTSIQPFVPIEGSAEPEEAFDPYAEVDIPSGYNVKACSIERTLESLNLDELSLEEEILKQMKEVELEDELDLLDKILIS